MPVDQRNLCGIGNVWKSEACFLAGIDPWRPVSDVSDEEALRAVLAVRPLMLKSGHGGGHARDELVFERTGRPCRRCGTRIRARGQGDDNRIPTFAPNARADPVGTRAPTVAPATRSRASGGAEHGVDMIDFDVLRTRDGRLVLAHDYEDSESRECVTLAGGLEHFAGETYAGIQLDVDLKLPGYEREVVDGLARHGLTERSLVSTMYPDSLERLGELEPGLRRGWSVPRVRRN